MRNKKRMTASQYFLGGSSQHSRKRGKCKHILTGKKQQNCHYLHIIVCIKSSKESIENILELSREFGKVSGCKLNI